MPKNASGSWVGTSMQPTFRTYQTAGMLQPSAEPSPSPGTPPVVGNAPVPDFTLPPEFAPPVITPIAPPGSVGIDVNAQDSRARLANAIISTTRGGGGTGSVSLGAGRGGYSLL